MFKKFQLFEEIVDLGPLKNMEYSPIFLKNWSHILSLYNNYGDKLKNFFDVVENDLHMLSASGYSVGKIDNGLSREETKKFMQLKAKINDKLEEFAKEFGKAKMSEEKYKMGPMSCFLINGQEITEKMPLERMKEIVYSPKYTIVIKYFNEIWKHWENFETIYSNFFHDVKRLIADNPLDMFADFQEILEKYKNKMNGKKLLELPSLPK